MFVIVKYADKQHQKGWCNGNPEEGVFASLSAHDTYTGKVIGMKPYYKTKEEAEPDLKKAIEENPTVGYAICPVLPFWSDQVQDVVLEAIRSVRPTSPIIKVFILVNSEDVIECVISKICIDFLDNAEKPAIAISSVTFKNNIGYFIPPKKHDVFILSIDF